MSKTVLGMEIPDATGREAFKRLRLAMECDQCRRLFVLTRLSVTDCVFGMGSVKIISEGNILGRSPLKDYINPVTNEMVFICKDCLNSTMVEGSC
jgi:hypothetical protein